MVIGQNFWYEWEALVTRNLHAKYKGSILNGSKVLTNVKVFQQTNKPTNQQTDRAKTICPRYCYGGHKMWAILKGNNWFPIDHVVSKQKCLFVCVEVLWPCQHTGVMWSHHENTPI